MTGMVSAMPSVAILILMPLFPRICGRLGTVPSMMLGCTAGMAALITMPLLPTIPAWAVLRFVMGAGLALPWLVGETWINALALDHERGRVLGLYAAALFAGFALGPMLLSVTGTEGWPPFLLAAGALLAAMGPLAMARAVAPPMPARPALRLIEALRRAPSTLAAAFAAGFAEAALFALLPVHGLRVGLPQDASLRLLSVFLIGGIALQYPLGCIADRVSRRGLLLAAALAAAVGLLLLPFANGAVLAVLAFLLGGVVLGFYSIGLAMLGERFGSEDLAVANAAFILLYEAGAVMGPSLSGGAMDAIGRYGLGASVASVSVMLAAVAALRGRRARHMSKGR
jgi:MFS family permease